MRRQPPRRPFPRPWLPDNDACLTTSRTSKTRSARDMPVIATTDAAALGCLTTTLHVPVARPLWAAHVPGGANRRVRAGERECVHVLARVD